MKIIVLGATGMLGSDICLEAEKRGHTVQPFSSKTCPINNLEATENALKPHADADIIINCAAYTQVDRCEAEKDQAFDVNKKGVEHLAKVARDFAIPIVHFSTDYVFDGQKKEPYVETDHCNPISIYGESKWHGEEVLKESGTDFYIFRVQWLYGKHGHHFIKTIQKLAHQNDSLSIVNDQWGAPTATTDIANVVLTSLESQINFGIYHLTSQGKTTWYHYAKEIVSLSKIKCQITPCATEDYPRPANRPANGVLNCQKLTSALGQTLPDWKAALKQFLIDA